MGTDHEMTSFCSCDSFQQVLANGDGCQFRAIGSPEFHEQRLDVFLDDGPADAELRGDFRVVEALDQRLQDFWLSFRETCWAVDYRNVSGETPGSGFTALDTRTEIGWKDLYFGLDVVAPLDRDALPHRRGQYYRPLVVSAGYRHTF